MRPPRFVRSKSDPSIIGVVDVHGAAVKLTMATVPYVGQAAIGTEFRYSADFWDATTEADAFVAFHLYLRGCF